jgi:arsenate reductase (thioredoxin)
MMRRRLELLVNLPDDKLEKARLQGTARELASH